MMEARYDVVVIGAGVAGASLCMQLARQGLNVALVEQGVAGGGGATALSGGIVRVHDPDPALARLSEAGRALFLEWEQLGLRAPSPYIRSGAFWLRRSRQTESLGGGIQVGRIQDFPQLTFLRDREDNPQVLYEPDSGYVDSRRLCAALLSEALSIGVDVYENTVVTGHRYLADQTVQVSTKDGSFIADRLAICTGADMPQTALMSECYSRSIPLVTVRVEGVTPGVPVIDEAAATYIRPLRGDRFFCGSQKWCMPGQTFDRQQVQDDALMRLRRLLGAAPTIDVINVAQKFDSYTEDLRPIIRFVEGSQIFVLGGFSGRGVKYSLAAGVIGARNLVKSLGLRYQRSLWDDCLDNAGLEHEESGQSGEIELA